MIQVPDAINRYSEVDLWGVTPTSILAANHVLSEPSNPVEAEWSLLRRHYDLWVLRTNYQPPWTVYRDFIADLTKHLLEGPVKQTAIFVDPDQYRQFIAGCLYHNGSDGVIRLLNWAIQQYDPDTPDARIRIHRQDISQYAKQSDIRILTAIQAVAYTSTGYNFDPTVIKSLASGLGRDRGSAATSLLARILGRLGVDAPKDVIPELLAALDYPIPDELTTRPAGNIPIYVLHHSLEPLVNDLFTTTLSQAINDLQDSVANQYASLEEVRRVDFVPSDGASEVPWPLSDQGAAVCAVMSQRGVPVAADWLVEVEADEDIFALHARLQDAGFAVTLQNRLLRFDEAYRAPTPPEQALEEYQAWLDQRTTALRSRSWVLADLENRIERVAEIHRLEITGQSMAVLDEYEISPTTFVYSMLDPDRLKQYSEDRYVGESDHLVDELHWIREWRKEAPVDARPYSHGHR